MIYLPSLAEYGMMLRRVDDVAAATQLSRVAAAVRDGTPWPAYAVMRAARQRYHSDRTLLHLHDPGAGHRRRGGGRYTRTVAAVARTSSGAFRYHRFLYRLARAAGREGPLLELGTALALGTLALALGTPHAPLYTLEGDPALIPFARNLISRHHLQNVTLLQGTFDDVLPSLLTSLPAPLRLVFLDGHHEKEATLRYFSLLLPHTDSQSILIVDDIRWSADMWQAWKELKNHPRVTTGVDLLRMGILLFDPALPRRHLSWPPPR